MGHARLTELRNASEKTGLSIRKNDPLELEDFLAQWRIELKRQGAGWEGRRAVSELKRKEMYEFLLCEKKSDTEWQAEDLFTRIVDEMKAYRKEATGRLARECFEEIDDILRGVTGTIQKKEGETDAPRLKALLSDLRKEVERTRKTVERLMQERRDRHFGIWQHLWPEIPRKYFVSKKIDLDSRLQVGLGRMFADYLRPSERHNRASMETIARLILLAYRVGGLSYEDEAGTRMHGTRRKLTVRNIRENLRFAGLHKAASFRGNRT
jgi:hypothetical protein